MKARRKPPGFFRKHRLKIAAGLILALGGVFFALSHSSSSQSKRQVSEVTLLAPPPPPPPPPPRPPPPKQMVEQTPVDKPEPKPQANNAPKSAPSGLPTNGKGGGMAGGGGGDGGGGGSRFGWYASAVQTTIRQALEGNSVTRHSTIGITVRIWADVTGRITRAKLVNSTGNPSLDDAIRNQVLLQTSLPGGPPPGMDMPINIRITAHP
jgi:protein TonB